MAQNPNGAIDKIDKGKQIYDKIQNGKEAGVAVQKKLRAKYQKSRKIKES